MKMFPRLFPVIVLALTTLPAGAEDWAKKDSQVLAKEALKTATQLRQEAAYFESRAQKEGRTLSSDEKKYLTFTQEEAGLLEKSFEAWDKNQLRMAEKLREKAGEACQKRGELAAKLKLWEENPAAAVETKPAAPEASSENSAKLAEIERQQAELEKKKKEIEREKAAGRLFSPGKNRPGRLMAKKFKKIPCALSALWEVHSVLGGTAGRRSYRCGGLHLFWLA